MTALYFAGTVEESKEKAENLKKLDKISAEYGDKVRFIVLVEDPERNHNLKVKKRTRVGSKK